MGGWKISEMNFKAVGWEGMKLILMVQDKGKWWAVMNMIMNLAESLGNSWNYTINLMRVWNLWSLITNCNQKMK
jgi:hypothetical protein